MPALSATTAGLTGKMVADKSKHWQEGQKWDITAVITSLEAELGKVEGKAPCPFFHVKGSCRQAADKCRWYH